MPKVATKQSTASNRDSPKRGALYTSNHIGNLYDEKLAIVPDSLGLWFIQFEALLRKHFITSYRSGWIGLVLRTMMPALLILIACIVVNSDLQKSSLLGVSSSSAANLETRSSADGLALLCPGSQIYCYPSVHYTPQTLQTKAIMDALAAQTGLKNGIDIFEMLSAAEMVANFQQKRVELSLRHTNYLIQFTFTDEQTFYTLRREQREINIDYEAQIVFFQLQLDRAILTTQFKRKIDFRGSIAAFPQYKRAPKSAKEAATGGQSTETICKLLALLILAPYALHIFSSNALLWNMNERTMIRLRQFNLYETAYWTSTFADITINAMVSTALGALLVAIPIMDYQPEMKQYFFFISFTLYLITFCTTSSVFITLGRSRVFAWTFRTLYLFSSLIVTLIFGVVDPVPNFYDYILAPIFPALTLARHYLLMVGQRSKANLAAYSHGYCIFLYILSIVAGFFLCLVLGQILGQHKPIAIACSSKRNKNPKANADTKKWDVIVTAISKSFGSFTALDKVSLNLKRGIINALLGHNGSGKSTLINILSGVLNPTTGHGTIAGQPIGTRAGKRALGVCPQADAVYPDLSAYDHMRLFSRLRGVPSGAIQAYIARLLDAVALGHQQIGERAVSKFSGGMRRRLSIISALAGNPEVLIFDEPTSGLDPINRRQVWDFLTAVKANATIIVTSHSNQEVEVLADDVVVLAAGRVVLQQNLLQFKRSKSLELQVTLRNAGALGRVGVPLIANEIVRGNMHRITIAQEHFVALTAWLESSVVISWQRYSSMKELLPPQPGTNEPESSKKDQRVANIDAPRQAGASASEHGKTWSQRKQFKAPVFTCAINQTIGIFIKHWQIQLRAWKANIFLLLIFVAYWYLLTKIRTPLVSPQGTNENLFPELFDTCSASKPAGCIQFGQFLETLKKSGEPRIRIQSATLLDQAPANYPKLALSKTSEGFDPEWLSVSDDTKRPGDNEATSKCHYQSALLGSDTDTRNKLMDSIPHFTLQMDPASDNTIDFKMRFWENRVYPFFLDNNCSIRDTSFLVESASLLSPFAQLVFDSATMQSGDDVNRNSTKPKILRNAQRVKDGANSYTDLRFAGLALVLVVWFLFPIFARNPLSTTDKSDAFLRVQGLWTIPNVIAQYFFNATYAVVILVPITLLTVFLVNIRFDYIFRICLLQVHYIIGLALLYGYAMSAFNLRQLGGFMSYLIPLVALSIAVVYSSSMAPVDVSHVAYYLPGVALFYLNSFQHLSLGFKHSWRASLALLLGGFVLIILSIAFARPSGSLGRFVGRLTSMLRGFGGSSGKTKTASPANTASKRGGYAGVANETAKQYLKEERSRVRSKGNSDQVALDGVGKSYGADTVIFEDVTMGIGAGCGFGLLGANGSGKSHLVGIITRQMQATSGTLRTLGAGSFGLIPQDSILEELLTVGQNLRYYARLRGMGLKASMQAADQAAQRVGLQDFFGRKVHLLSGGMKRRVAIAVALLGGPRLIVADEPTTALDVHHKENIWRTLAGLREENGTTLLLVSHEMEEVQYVTQRAAILHQRLLFIGTLDEMANVYSRAWQLVVQCKRADTEQVQAWVRGLGYELLVAGGGGGGEVVKLEYRLRHRGGRKELSELSRTIESEHRRVGVSEWFIAPLTLEDAFVGAIKSA